MYIVLELTLGHKLLFQIVHLFSELSLSIACHARCKATLFIDETIQVMGQSGDQSMVLAPSLHVGVVVNEPDVCQGVFEVLLIHH
jgi:hypothetical protein